HAPPRSRTPGKSRNSPRLLHSDDLVRLQRQSPARMGEAIVDRGLRIARNLRPVHGLQQEFAKVEGFIVLGLGPGLRKNELQLVAARQRERRPGLGRDANPVEACRGGKRPIRLDRELEALVVQRRDQRAIDLQQRLAPCQHRKTARRFPAPEPGEMRGQSLGGGESAAPLPLRADEIRIAEATLRPGAVLLAPAPEIAAGEAAEDGGPPGLTPLALQSEKGFLDGVGHRLWPAALRRLILWWAPWAPSWRSEPRGRWRRGCVYKRRRRRFPDGSGSDSASADAARRESSTARDRRVGAARCRRRSGHRPCPRSGRARPGGN